jgi:DNA repair photolyase
MSIIYEPAGRAGEYAPLAANIYKSCSHGCLYCYANKMMKLDKVYFHAENRIRKDAIILLEKDAAKLRGDDREILFCFLGDPYNPDEHKNGITRQAIEIMIRNDLRFTLLTKGGARARRDLDLLEGYFKCSIGQTIVWSKQESASHWEPNAAPLQERFELAQEAHKRGIKTWVSLEPVIDPDQALEVVRLLHPYVNKWKVGPVNYVAGVNVDWFKFKNDIVKLLDEVGAEYILKNELIKKAA